MKNNNFRSENGAALVLEATIIYPIVLVVVMFMIFWGLTYLQNGYLNYASAQVSHYISKTILYPGYQYLEEPYAGFVYSRGSEFGDKTTWTVQNRVELAMDEINPYRYLFGLDGEVKEIIDGYDDYLVDMQLPGGGFLRAEEGALAFPDGMGFDYTSVNENGYTCGISAAPGSVSVYLAQKYVFSDLYRMIGVGGRAMRISALNTVFVCDSVEVLRNADLIFELIEYTAGQLGFDFEKMNEVINMFTGNG